MTIGVAVIGAGRWGPNLARNFAEDPRASLRWIVDQDERRLAAVRARYPNIRTAHTLDPVLADGDVQAVVVATPTVTHFDLAAAALRANKHVLVEKPLAPTRAACQVLQELSEKHDRLLMVGHVFVFNSGIIAAKKALDTGELGALQYCSATRTNLGPVRADCNVAWDLVTHDISIANWWLGTPPLAVSARGGSWVNRPTEDTIFATLTYPNNVLFGLTASWLNPKKVREITVVGEKKMLVFDDMQISEPIRIYDSGVGDETTELPFVDSFGSFRMSVRDGQIVIPKVQHQEPLRAECAHFIECIVDKRPPKCGAIEAIDVVRTLEAIDKSLAGHGKEVEVTNV